MRRWLLAACVWAWGGIAQAGNELELFEADQRLARYSFAVGASSPAFMVAGLLLGEENPTAGAIVGGVGVLGTAVSLPLLGRRSMLAADHLELTGGKGALTIFFSIGNILGGAYFLAVEPSNTAAVVYLASTGAALTLGGLQLRENRFVATMRTDPRTGLWLTPTPNGLALAGRF